MCEGVTLSQAALRRDVLIAARKGDRLEGNKGDFLGILAGKFDDRPHLIIVDAVHESGYQNDLDARLVHVVNGLQLHIKQVAYLPVRIRIVADAVNLKIGVAEARVKCPPTKSLAFDKLNT